MNIVVVGQGAIGLLWYTKLLGNIAANPSSTENSATPHFQLKLLSSNTGFQKNQTLTFNTLSGQQFQIPLNHANEKDIENADIILVCVKSYQVAEALEKIPVLKSGAVIILCHNGLGTLTDEIIEKSSDNSIFAMLISHGCRRDSEVEITHTGEGEIELGLSQGQLKLKEKTKILNLLNSAMSARWQDDIKDKQWKKLAVNCVINPLTAIHDVTNGDILLPKFSKEIDGILEEFIAVAKANEITFNFQDLKKEVLKVAEATRKNCSSMRADILNSRRTEIDFINGFIAQNADKAKLHAPFNKHIVEQIKAINHG